MFYFRSDSGRNGYEYWDLGRQERCWLGRWHLHMYMKIIYKTMLTDIIYNKLIFTHMRMYVSNEDKILKTLFVYEQDFF